METNDFRRVLDALRQLVGSCDNTLITAITRTISEQMGRPGYIAILASIIRCTQLERPVIFAALTQLRNIVKMNRGTKMEREKNWEWGVELRPLVQCMIELNTLYSGSRQELKLLKDICQFTAEELLPLGPVLHEMLVQGRQLKACLNILLGIANAFLYEILSVSAPFLQTLEYILPAIHRLIHIGEENLTALYYMWHSSQQEEMLKAYHAQRAAFEEILYMGIKFVGKSLHQNASVPLREHYCLWAAIAQNRLQEQNQQYSQLALQQPNECGRRGSDEFNYFHGKKWAAKFMSRLINKILIIKRSHPEVSAVTTAFMRAHSQPLKLTLRHLFQHVQPTYLRYYQLMLLDTFSSSMPVSMRQEIPHYLTEVVPSFAAISSQDLSNLTNNPQEFLAGQAYKDTPRGIAMDIWARMAKSDSERYGLKVHDLKEGEILVLAFSRIREWLRDGTAQVREVALSLMNRLDLSIYENGRASAIAEQIVSLCLPHIFHQPELILHVRGYQLITHYRKLIPSETYPVLKDTIMHVFQERSMDNGIRWDILAIWAGVALEKVISFGEAQLNEEEIRLVLTQVLGLIKLYEVAQLNETLMAMITCYPQQMHAYSIQLVRYLAGAIREVFARTVESPVGQHSESTVEIMGVLATLATLGVQDGEFDVGLREVLQEELCSLLEYALSYEDQIFPEYVDGLFRALRGFLNSLTNKVSVLSSRICFFFTFLIFQVVPFDTQCILACANSSQTPFHRTILQSSTKGNLSTPLLFNLFREYLKYLDPLVQVLPAAQLKGGLFKTDMLNQWSYLMVSCYRNRKDKEEQPYGILQERYLVTALLICLLEHHQNRLPEKLYMLIFKIIAVNHKTCRFRPHLSRKNIELFLMWVWAYPNSFNYAESQKMPISQLCMKILFHKGLIPASNALRKSAFSRRRAILGLSRLIQLEQFDTTLHSFNHLFMEWLFFMAATNSSSQDADQDYDEVPEGSMYAFQREEEVQPGEVVFQQGQQGETQDDQGLATDGGRIDVDELIDEEEGEDEVGKYQEKSYFNEMQYLLDTLLIFKASRPEQYCNSVFPLHGWKIAGLVDYCSPQLRQKYGQLIIG